MSHNEVFSEFEVKETGMLFSGQTQSTRAGCVGSMEESMDTKSITKKCEGVETKRVVKGAGTGTLKISLHILYELFAKIYGMNFADTLKAGVRAYGKNSRHEAFCLTCKVLDEDGNIKYRAYPNAIATEGFTRKVTNGDEEVAEVEMSYFVMPDDQGNAVYEAIDEDFADTAAKTQWLENWNYGLVAQSASDYFVVTFNSDGGSAVSNQTIQSGAMANRPVNPTKSGYIFAGWQLGEVDYDFYSPVTAAITLVAEWTVE